MRKGLYSILLCGLFLGGAELAVRCLYLLAGSSVYRAWFLAWDRGSVLELEAGDLTFLRDGFLPPVRTPEGQTFVWAGATHATLDWPLLWPSDRRLRLRLRRFPHPSAAGEPLELTWNGSSLGTMPPGSGWLELELAVPRSLQDFGRNELGFRTQRLYAASSLPEGKTDPRLLGFQLDRVELQ